MFFNCVVAKPPFGSFISKSVQNKKSLEKQVSHADHMMRSVRRGHGPNLQSTTADIKMCCPVRKNERKANADAVMDGASERSGKRFFRVQLFKAASPALGLTDL